jgi:glucose/arabinose dehydrogenase
MLALTAGTIAVFEASPQRAAAAPDLNNPQVIATGLQVPWGLDFLPDGSALVTERMSARVLRLRQGQAPTQVTTINGVVPGGEGGLLGLAVSPNFAQDNFVYVYFTAANDNRIARFRLDTPQTQQVILSGMAKAQVHDGGRIAFGPDGMLYATVGDAGNTASAQNQSSLNGKILRMTPTGGVPAGNPFGNSVVWSMGHRHPQGITWDSQGRMYAAEFGQNTWDEINLIVAGGNYGWPTVEGMGNNPNFRNPLVVWTTAESSPSGLEFDTNTLYAGALRGQRLWTVPLNGSGGVSGSPVARLQGQYGRIRTVERAPDGALWITTSNRDGRGTPVAADDRVVRFPAIGTPPPPPPPPNPPPPNPPPPNPPPPNPPPPNPPPPNPPPPNPPPPNPPPPNPPPPPPVGGCTSTVSVNQWNGGFVVTVRVTAGTAAINGWTVSATLPGGAAVTNAWNANRSGNSGNVQFTNVSYNGRIAAGQSTEFGFQGTGTGTGTTSTCSAS